MLKWSEKYNRENRVRKWRKYSESEKRSRSESGESIVKVKMG